MAESVAWRAFPVTLLLNQAGTSPIGSSHWVKLLKCCSASSSVGAVIAAW